MDLHIDWLTVVGKECEKPYFLNLMRFLEDQRMRNVLVYPQKENVFRVFSLVSFEDVKVVLLGQDPYHNPHQANGLAFSVLSECVNPPSLKNIYKEVRADVGHCIFDSGDLSGWAHQGVLLLNTTLTVEDGKPGAHSKKGWQEFTDCVIEKLSDEREHLVFLLWGKHAQKKEVLIDEKKHLILKAPHPSPLSAYRGFFGCHHFSKTNAFLNSKNMKIIEW
jgi:uracil-DNA glycosylase